MFDCFSFHLLERDRVLTKAFSFHLVPVETLIRPKNETPEERKARKDGIKSDRSSRRAEKKGTKEAFGNEMKRQKKIATKKVAGGGAADVRVGEGVRRLA